MRPREVAVVKLIELRRHTANDGDELTAEGVVAAVRIGATLTVRYPLVVSSGAQRATQAAACFIAGMGVAVPGGVVVDHGFRSEHEDRWREIYAKTQKGDIEAFLLADYAFVEGEGRRFTEALRRVLAHTPENGCSLVVGHSPMLEAAVWGATGETVRALGKGEAVVLVHEQGGFSLHQ
jgi:broad specificity phosphatase PhoE